MLSIEEGKDYDQVLKSQLPYELLENLGHGASGAVEKVKDALTGELFARKIIRRPRARAQKEKQAIVFRNEVKIIRRLESHRHIIRLFATYTTENEFGLVLHPVASDGDLEQYLADYQNDAQAGDAAFPDSRLSSMTASLEQAFGCLISGMAYMHKNRVRHKDVKLQNILMHKGQVLYTDFGYSFDSNERSRSLTQGRPGPMTAKYSAPEVLAHEPRDSSSDIYSLGCVFISVLSALTSASTLDVQEIPSFASSMDDIHQHMTYWHTNSRTARLPAVITQMTRRDPSDRMCAVHIADRIFCLPGLSCQECAMHTIDPGSECTKLENCLRIAQSNKFIPLSSMRRTQSENAILFNGYSPAIRAKIREWTLTHLKQSAIQKRLYLNALEDHGIESSVEGDWRARATHFWSRDSFDDTRNDSKLGVASTGHEARCLNDSNATQVLRSMWSSQTLGKSRVTSWQSASLLPSPSRGNRFLHEVEHNTENRTPAPGLDIWDERQQVLGDLYLTNIAADLPECTYPVEFDDVAQQEDCAKSTHHSGRAMATEHDHHVMTYCSTLQRPDVTMMTKATTSDNHRSRTHQNHPIDLPIPRASTSNHETSTRIQAQARRNTISWFRQLLPHAKYTRSKSSSTEEIRPAARV